MCIHLLNSPQSVTAYIVSCYFTQPATPYVNFPYTPNIPYTPKVASWVAPAREHYNCKSN